MSRYYNKNQPKPFEEIDARRSQAVNLVLRTCVTCDMFNLEGETCNKWNARPPAKVIAYGCDSYIEDIPF